ncbi:MAG: hypothetical protein PHX38_01850 [Sulfuricella sp.]|nr:hypothetical protein [Sulfuricella sp.]
MKKALILMLASVALLAACEQKPYKPPVPNTDQDKPAVKLFEPQREALDKAKEVGKTLEQAGRDRGKAAEEAGR